MFKPSKERRALKAVLRLLVFLREAMKAEGAKDTTLYKSVVDHSNLVGSVLPNKDRVSGEELERILTAMKTGAGIPEMDGAVADKLAIIGAASSGKTNAMQSAGSRVIVAGGGDGEMKPRLLPERGDFVVLSPDQIRKPLIKKP